MRITRFARALWLVPALMMAAAIPAGAACTPLLDHSVPRLQDNTPQSLCQYQGQVLMVVNTASYCGFTSQYEGLQRLYEKYRARGLVVLGFPSNDFGAQEPGSAKEIADFCSLTYGVQFPMFAKTRVVEGGAHPFYEMLARQSGERPRWNFHKYLIDRSGKRVQSFPSRTAPDSRELVAAVERLLQDK